MGSKSHFSMNVAFGAAMMVCGPSYYFCVKRLEQKDKVVKIMMKANEFDPMEEMPETPDIEDHPFLESTKDGKESLDKEFHMYKKEPKPWEKSNDSNFVEVDKKK